MREGLPGGVGDVEEASLRSPADDGEELETIRALHEQTVGQQRHETHSLPAEKGSSPSRCSAARNSSHL